MKYEKIITGKFNSRPNRFIAEVTIDGIKERAHVKNTGRCKELLTKGAEVYLEDFENRMGKRKMRYSLIGVKKGRLIINMDSQAPNKVCYEALSKGTIKLPEMDKLSVIKREKTYGKSRFDFYVEDVNGKTGWLEVKGVTLEDNGIARFPDAPTERGVKHLRELSNAVKEGYEAYILFVIQMKGVNIFEPNDKTHQEFGDVLREASKEGVHIMACDCVVTKSTLRIDKSVDINLFGKNVFNIIQK